MRERADDTYRLNSMSKAELEDLHAKALAIDPRRTATTPYLDMRRLMRLVYDELIVDGKSEPLPLDLTGWMIGSDPATSVTVIAAGAESNEWRVRNPHTTSGETEYDVPIEALMDSYARGYLTKPAA